MPSIHLSLYPACGHSAPDKFKNMFFHEKSRSIKDGFSMYIKIAILKLRQYSWGQCAQTHGAHPWSHYIDTNVGNGRESCDGGH